MPLLPGQSPPLLDLDSTHRGALVVIAGAIALTVTLVGLIIRLYIHIAVNPHYGKDDLFLLLATVLGFCQSIVVFFSVSKGFGNSIDLIYPEDLKIIRRIYYTGDILYLVTIYLTKCCVLCIFLKLTPKRAGHHRATWAAFIIITLWIIPSILMVSINCGFSNPVGNAVHICQKVFLRWQLIVAFDVITEIILFILATMLLRNLQMRLHRKLIVLSAFAARLPLIAFSLTRLTNFDHDIHTLNPSLELVSTSVWTQIHMHYSIIACTVFSLRTFTAAVSTHYGTAGSQALDSGVNSRVGGEEGGSNGVSSGSGSGNGSGGGKRRGSLASPAWFIQAGDRDKDKGRYEIGDGDCEGEGKMDEEAMIGGNQKRTRKGKEKENKKPKTTPLSQQRFSMGKINIEPRPLSILGKRKATITTPQTSQTSQTSQQRSEQSNMVAPPIPGVTGRDNEDIPQSTATVTRNVSGTGGGGGGRRHGRSGQGSGDSTKWIIQRDVEYSVQYRSRQP